MHTNKQRFRWLAARLPTLDKRRLVVLTGARQTGKTTLARQLYPGLRYVNLDSIEDREAMRQLHTARWGRDVGPAVLDEAQKEPRVFDKVKFAYDERSVSFSVLLGSSRILLLERVRESLAGRAFTYELWPLMASEVRTAVGERPAAPLFDALVTAPRSFTEILRSVPLRLLGEAEAIRVAAFDHLARWGGMPELLSLDDRDRREWLRSYQHTWLERDLADLTRLRDLLPFRTLQRLAMLRSGGHLNYSELGRDAGVEVTTARRYLEFLRLSYQVVLLPPYRRNLTSASVKTPKLYWTDIGLLRQGAGIWGDLTGEMFETLVVAEAHKWIETLGRDARLSFWRTRSGREVDLLVTTPEGILGLEVKGRRRIAARDTSGLRALAEALGDEWAGGLVVHRGDHVEELSPRLWAVPAHRLF